MAGTVPDSTAGSRAISVGVAYFAANLIGIRLGDIGAGISTFWPANGVLVGLLLALPVEQRIGPVVAAALAGLAANLAAGNPIAASLACTGLNLGESLLALYAMERFGGRPFHLTSLRQGVIVVGTSLATAALTATIATILLPTVMAVRPLEAWVIWFAFDATGMILFLPVALRLGCWLFGSGLWTIATARRLAEPIVVLALMVAMGGLVLETRAQNIYFVFAIVLSWTALRCGVGPTAAGSALLAVVSAIGASRGMWPVPFEGMVVHPPQVLLTGPLIEHLLIRSAAVLTALPALSAAILQEHATGQKMILDQALRAMQDPFAVWSPSGRLLACNPAYERVWLGSHPVGAEGLDRVDLLRLAQERIVGARDVDLATWLAGRRALIEGELDDEVQHVDGTIYHNRRWRSDRGVVTYVGRDVTARRGLERDLAAAKRLLDDALGAMSDSFAILDADRRLLYWNKGFERCFRRVADRIGPNVPQCDLLRAMVPAGAFSGLDEDRAVAFVEERIAALRVDPEQHYEMWVDGRCMDVRTHGIGAGGVIRISTDVTALKLAEREARGAEARLDAALGAVDYGFAIFDRDLRLVHVNQATLDLFPDTRDVRVVGASFDEILRAGLERDGIKGADASQFEAVRERARAILSGASANEVELTDGRRIEIVARPTPGGDTILTYRDVTELRRREESLRHAARHDALTGLANRPAFDAELVRARARAERDGTSVAVLLIDLDKFKQVNDEHGHAVGDRLLAEIGKRLAREVRDGDMVARLGGDEFAIVAQGRGDPAGYATLASRIVEVVGAPLEVADATIRPGCSVGVAVFPDDPSDVTTLLQHADEALYLAKQAGRGTWRRFRTEQPGARGLDPWRMSETVLAALDAGELDLDYQPIVDLRSGALHGVEAFLRWNHPRHGRLDAGAFIGAVEHGPALLPLTRFALGAALRTQRRWHDAGAGDAAVWVNLAPRAAAAETIVRSVEAALAEAGAPADALVLEITESALEQPDLTTERLAALDALGVTFALDDFAAGHSSLTRLDRLAVRHLKVDRGLTRAAATADPRGTAILRTIAQLARDLGVVDVAEAVESPEQAESLRALGFTLAQGYAVARPMPADALLAWLQRSPGHGNRPASAAVRVDDHAA